MFYKIISILQFIFFILASVSLIASLIIRGIFEDKEESKLKYNLTFYFVLATDIIISALCFFEMLTIYKDFFNIIFIPLFIINMLNLDRRIKLRKVENEVKMIEEELARRKENENLGR